MKFRMFEGMHGVPKSRGRCDVKVAAFMMMVASSLSVIIIFHRSINWHLETSIVKPYSNDVDLFRLNSSITSMEGAGNIGDQLIASRDDVHVSNDATIEPTFVLHIGPHKTATSVIQCDLTRYRKELYDTASVAYLGRVYHNCLKSRHGNRYSFQTRTLINSCFKNGHCKARDSWKELESELAYLSKHKKHAILSDEAFARMHITARNDEDNRQVLFNLVRKYYPGRMRVVIVYRRYFEWQLSVWNQSHKPFVNGNGDSSEYKSNYKSWPSEGGKRCKTFLSHMKEFMDPDEDGPLEKYRHKAEAKHVHVADYLRTLWSNHTNDVQVLNLHNMSAPSDNGEDTTSRFLQHTLTPLAAETYIHSKDSEFGGRHNPSRNINYDILAVAAYEKGILSDQSISRAKVAVLLEENLMNIMNTTHLPLQCPSEEELERFLQKSLHYEELLYPDQTQADIKEHTHSFYEAVKKNKFCSFDFDKLVEDEAVKSFFREEIPRLYQKSK